MFLLCCKKKKISFGRHDEYIALVPVFVCMGVHILCFFIFLDWWLRQDHNVSCSIVLLLL